MKTNEASQDKQAQSVKDSFNYEEWLRAQAPKYDSPEFVAAEAEKKANLLSEIRFGEMLEQTRKAVRRPQWNGEGTAGWTVEARPLYGPDWSETHEA